MPELRPVELSIEDAAHLLHVQPQTVRRRVRAKELRSAETIGPGPAAVRLSPAEDWIRVEDASALLGVSPATVRSNISRGRLAGRREKNGRWRVLLRSVLEDRRCDPAALEAFGGERPMGEPWDTLRQVQIHDRGRPRPLHRQLNIRLNEEQAELLERCRDRHGTITAAIVVGLQAIDRDDVDVDRAEVLVERDLYRGQLERVRSAHRGLQARAEGRMVDELYCHRCEAMVPIEETDRIELEDGSQEIFHRKHGHRSGSRIRSNTVIARRAKLTLEPAE
jgi:hypothetical protein